MRSRQNRAMIVEICLQNNRRMQQKSEYLNAWAGLAPGALLAFTLARLKNSYKWRLCSKIVTPATSEAKKICLANRAVTNTCVEYFQKSLKMFLFSLNWLFNRLTFTIKKRYNCFRIQHYSLIFDGKQV